MKIWISLTMAHDLLKWFSFFGFCPSSNFKFSRHTKFRKPALLPSSDTGFFTRRRKQSRLPKFSDTLKVRWWTMSEERNSLACWLSCFLLLSYTKNIKLLKKNFVKLQFSITERMDGWVGNSSPLLQFGNY